MPVQLLIHLADQTPEPEDVTAGGWGGLMFVLLIVAVALLMLSFLKQMRKTEQARREGVFGDELTDPTEQGGPTESAGPAEPADGERRHD